jgi:hypothetical protein
MLAAHNKTYASTLTPVTTVINGVISHAAYGFIEARRRYAQAAWAAVLWILACMEVGNLYDPASDPTSYPNLVTPVTRAS